MTMVDPPDYLEQAVASLGFYIINTPRQVLSHSAKPAETDGNVRDERGACPGIVTVGMHTCMPIAGSTCN